MKKVKIRVPKSVRNTFISVIVLLMIVMGAGIWYTWYMGRNPENSKLLAEPAIIAPKKVAEPQQPGANVRVGVSIQSITSPVIPGQNTSMTIRTNPGSKCTIAVIYDKMTSNDSGLKSKVADDYGMVTWTWTVETNANQTSVLLQDGSVVIVASNTWINIDINGGKGPNVFGKDLFAYKLQNGKLYPDGHSYTDGVVTWYCSKTGSHDGDGGSCCLEKIVRDNWQIKSNYPWN